MNSPRAFWAGLIVGVLATSGLFAQSPPVTGPEPSAISPTPAPPEPTAADLKPILDRLDIPPTFQIRGRIETEGVVSQQSQASQAAIGNLVNGFGFRRVRVGAQGSYGDSTSWVSEVELAGGSVRLRDVFVGLDALPGVRQVRVGHFREPYSLEGMTSSNFMNFTERSPINNLSPARNWGLCGFWWTDSERLLFTTGVFRDGTPSTGQSLGDGDNWAYTSRLTGLLIYEPDDSDFRLLHLGGAFSQRTPPNGLLIFSPRTASNLLTVDDIPGSPFLPSFEILANCYQAYNLQAASVHGPLSFQAEWGSSVVQQTNAGVIFVSGFYVAASYFLTGEHRGYNRTRGSFDAVDVKRPLIRSKSDPRGGIGAIELVTRFSHIDMTSPNLPLDVNGNAVNTRLFEISSGVNWYLHDEARIMFNYTAGIPDKLGFGPTVAHLFSIRVALFW